MPRPRTAHLFFHLYTVSRWTRPHIHGQTALISSITRHLSSASHIRTHIDEVAFDQQHQWLLTL